MTKEAVIYKRGERYFVHADSKTETGLWVACEPFLAVDEITGSEALEAAIMVALESSKDGLPHPSDFDAIGLPLYELAGVKTWNAFSRAATACRVVRADTGVIQVVPMKRSGQAFDLQEHEKIVLREATPGQLGDAVRKLLTGSQSRGATTQGG